MAPTSQGGHQNDLEPCGLSALALRGSAAGIVGQVPCRGQRPEPELGQLLGAAGDHPLCAVAGLAQS
jgi:hypothetical protein